MVHIKKRKKQRGGVEARYGPWDEMAHRFARDDQIKTHINIIQNDKNELGKKLLEAKSEIDKEEQKALEKERQKKLEEQNEYRRNLDEILQRNSLEQKSDSQATQAVIDVIGNTLGSAGTIVKSAVTLSGETIKDLALALGYVLDRSGSAVKLTTDVAGKVTGKVMDTVVYNMLKYFFQLIAIILLFVIIVFFLIYGFTLFAKKASNDPNAANGTNGKGCSNVLSDTIYVNIDGMNKLFSKDKITDTINIASDKAMSMLQKYDHIPDSVHFWSNPMGYFSFITTTARRSRGVDTAYRAVGSGLRGIRSFVGGSSEVLYSRDEDKRGRCDNIINIDTALISNDKLIGDSLSNKSVDTTGQVINITDPKDIIWNYPTESYVGKDYNKIPPELRPKFNNKFSITIPWEFRENQYRLSCNKAYFTDQSSSDLAHVLIDTVGELDLCSFNNVSKANKYTTNTKRYVGTTNLSNFLD